MKARPNSTWILPCARKAQLLVLAIAPGCAKSNPPPEPERDPCTDEPDRQGGTWSIVGTENLPLALAGFEGLSPDTTGLEDVLVELATLGPVQSNHCGGFDVPSGQVPPLGASWTTTVQSPCDTAYWVTGEDFGTSSPTGLASTCTALARADAWLGLDWPIAPLLDGSLYVPSLDRTLEFAGTIDVVRDADEVRQVVAYKLYIGDVVVAGSLDAPGQDDDCDGEIDEADETAIVDRIDPGARAVAGGRILLTMRRAVGSAPASETRVDEATALAIAPLTDVFGVQQGQARIAAQANDPFLRLSLPDPLHPGFELVVAVAPDADGRLGAFVSARQARYLLRGSRAGTVAVEAELLLLDGPQPRLWRVASPAGAH